MSIFGDIGKALFGDPQAATNAQQKSNKRSQAYTKEMADQARNDAIGLYGASSAPLKDGYQAAIDAIGGTTRQQIDTTARGNYFGQEALLSGMPEFQNAILGYGVDNTRLKPFIDHPEQNLQWMWNAQLGQRTGGHHPLEGLAPNELAALKTMKEAGLSNSQISDLAKSKMGLPTATAVGSTPGSVPVGTSRTQAKALLDSGFISKEKYQQILQRIGG